MLDQIDLAHSAGTKQPQDSVSGKGVTYPQRHGRMLAAAIDVTCGALTESPRGWCRFWLRVGSARSN